jgi:hypothetical protein
VAECLYRNQSSETYYALVKRNERQIRRSLKTQDRKLAERRLKDFRQSAERLSEGKDVKRLTFSELSERWVPTTTADLKPASKRSSEYALAGGMVLDNPSTAKFMISNRKLIRPAIDRGLAILVCSAFLRFRPISFHRFHSTSQFLRVMTRNRPCRSTNSFSPIPVEIYLGSIRG